MSCKPATRWRSSGRCREDELSAIDDRWTISGRELESRLFLGTARYPSRRTMLDALEASGTQVVTIAIRRVNLDAGGESLYTVLRERGFELLPNTAGCFTARDAVLTAELAREALETDWIKLEVIADEQTLLPDAEGLIAAAREFNIAAPESFSRDDRDAWLDLLLTERVEPHLGKSRPVILFDYPPSHKSMSFLKNNLLKTFDIK